MRYGDHLSGDLLGEVLIARQPILDRTLAVVASELLHLTSLTAPADPVAESRATASVLIDGVLGWRDHLVAPDEEAPINVPLDAFEAGHLLDLPATGLVLELPAVDDEVVPSRHSLQLNREAGFRVLLDNVMPDDPRPALVDDVDLVKVDLLGSSTGAALNLIRELARQRVGVIAGRVESPGLFDRTVAAGASLVQGLFFTRPRTVRAVRPVGLSPTHLGLLQACSAEPFDLDEVEQLIRQDVTLADRFLRLVSRPGLRWREVKCIRDGLLMLGDRAVRRWVRLLVLSAAVRDSHPETATLGAVRGRYCEALVEATGQQRQIEAVGLGMFSTLGHDVFVPPEIRAELPVSPDVEAALGGTPGEMRFGDIAAVWEMCQQLGVVEVVDEVVGARRADAAASVGTYLALATVNRIVESCSKRAFAGWWDSTEGPRFVRPRLPTGATDHRPFWDAMDTLELEQLVEIERRLSLRAVERFGLDLFALVLDMINFATFIDSANGRGAVAKRGQATVLPSHCATSHSGVANSPGCSASTCIRRPLRLTRRTCTALSSPRWTRCNTVWRATPRILAA